MAEGLSGGCGVVTAVVTITRKDTGLTEEYVLTGRVDLDDQTPPNEEPEA